MGRSGRMWWLLAATLLAMATADEQFQCTNQISDYCSCSMKPGREYEIECPPGEDVSFIINVSPDSLKIVCAKNALDWETTIKYLSGLKLGKVRSFAVQFCPGIPPFPFKRIIDSVGATDVQSFHYLYSCNYMSCNNATQNLSSFHLDGMEQVRHLDLNSNKLSHLSEDVFLKVPRLTWLDLKSNYLKLPRNVFKHTPMLEVLELGNNNMTFLEPGIFRNLTKLRLLNLWGNRLQNLTRSVFSDTPNLQSLDLHSNHMTSLSPDIFQYLSKLKELNLYGNNFGTLPRNLFVSNPDLEIIKLHDNRQPLRLPDGLLSNLKNLREVKMRLCPLINLPQDLFHGSDSITNITLRSVSIDTLPVNLFRDNVKLLNIDLSHNKLSYLPDKAFKNLRALVVLDLASNNISFISQDAFYGLDKLTDLNLQYNSVKNVHVSAFSSLIELRRINLSHNKLSSVQVRIESDVETVSYFSPQKLEVINLSYNNLSVIPDDWRRSKLNLKRIDLSHNSFTKINFNDLVFLSDFPEMDLSFNKISVVDFNGAGPLSVALQRRTNTALRLKLDGNPIECDCRAHSFLRYLRHETEPETYYVVEIDPTGLACKESGDNLYKIDPRLLVCENGEGCPNFCKCYYRPYDSALLVDCSSVGYTSPPDLNFFPTNLLKEINQTVVDLSNNSIVALPANFNLIGYNKTTKLNLSHNKFTNISKTWFNPFLQDLSLEFNNLTKLDDRVIDYFQSSPQLSKLTLSGNPWTCSCEAKNFLNFLQSNYNKIKNLKNITCSNGMRMANMTVSDLCPTSNVIIGLTSLIIAILGLVIGGLFALYYRYQKEIKAWLYARDMCLWFVTEEDLDKDKQYDAFISYSHQDEEFVANKLVPGLENGSIKYKLCLHYRDWVVGDFIPRQIARSVQESKRTVIVLSPAFIESVWGLMEFRTAYQQALSEGRSRLIVVLFGDIGSTSKLDPELKAYLAMNTYVKWGDPWFWEKLRYALPHPAKSQNLSMTTVHDIKPLKNGSTPTINSNTIDAPKAV